MSFMDQGEEALVDSLSDHFSSWDKLGIQLVENVLEVVSLNGFFGVKKFQEFLDELRGNVNFEWSNFNCLVDDELKEELIDTLEMWPGWFDLIFLLHTSLRELKIRLLEVGKWPEDIFLNHGHYIVKVRNNQANDSLLILKQLLDLINGVQSFGLAFDILRFVLVIVVLLTDQQLLLEALLGVLVGCATSSSLAWCISVSRCLWSCSCCRSFIGFWFLWVLHSNFN